jgi:hypothetical protein
VQPSRSRKKTTANINPITGQENFPVNLETDFEGDCNNCFVVGRFPAYKKNPEELLLFLPSGPTFNKLRKQRIGFGKERDR